MPVWWTESAWSATATHFFQAAGSVVAMMALLVSSLLQRGFSSNSNKESVLQGKPVMDMALLSHTLWGFHFQIM